MEDIKFNSMTAYMDSYIIQRKDDGYYKIKSCFIDSNGSKLEFDAPKCRIKSNFSTAFPTINNIEILSSNDNKNLFGFTITEQKE